MDSWLDEGVTDHTPQMFQHLPILFLPIFYTISTRRFNFKPKRFGTADCFLHLRNPWAFSFSVFFETNPVSHRNMAPLGELDGGAPVVAIFNVAMIGHVNPTFALVQEGRSKDGLAMKKVAPKKKHYCI